MSRTFVSLGFAIVRFPSDIVKSGGNCFALISICDSGSSATSLASNIHSVVVATLTLRVVEGGHVPLTRERYFLTSDDLAYCILALIIGWSYCMIWHLGMVKRSEALMRQVARD